MRENASRSTSLTCRLKAARFVVSICCVLFAAATAANAATDFSDYSVFTSASSTTISSIKIGSTTDSETAITANTTATGDDVTGSDDEDGVTVPSTLSVVSGTTGSLTVNVTNTSGATVFLNAWIDFNRNGVLTDSGEQIATNTTIATGTSASNKTVSFTVPSAAVTGTAGVRVRLTSTSSPGSTGLSGNGEVEDYVTTLVCPTLTMSPSSLSNGNTGNSYSQTLGTSGGTSPYTYALVSGSLPSGLSLNTSTGEISGIPTSTNSTTFTIRTTDAKGCTASLAYTVAPTCPNMVVTLPTPTATLGTAYSQTFITANDTGPYTYTLNSGTLPPWATLSSAGVLSGTPNSTTSYSFTIKSTDARGCTGTSTNYTIMPTNTVTLTVGPASLGAATVGTAYSQTITATQTLGISVQQAFSSTQINTLADADALLSGTNRVSNWTGYVPTINFSGSGNSHYTDTVFPGGDGDDMVLRATATITIPTAGAWTFGFSSDDGARLKVDGTTIINDDTQHGTTDRFATVTLTAGTHTIDLVYFDRSGGDVIELFAAAGTLSSFSSSFQLIGSASGLAVVQSPPTYTFALKSGTLPPWSTLNTSTGVLSGTPTNTTSYTFTIQATDTNGFTGTSPSYTITPSPNTDFGDYSSFGSASSTTNSNLRIGALVDSETTATTNATATGDDTTGSDDEDGVTVPASVMLNSAGTITVNVSNATGASAFLNVWIDYNRNGVLTDSGEQIAANTVIATGTSNSNKTINFTVPAGASIGTAGVRVRLTSTSTPGSTGASGAGEVEDYTVVIAPSLGLGNLIWNDANENGLFDAGESGIDNVLVELWTPGADNALGGTSSNADTKVTSMTTSGGGFYNFSGLTTGYYFVKVPTPPLSRTSLVADTTDNGQDGDNNGTQPGGSGTSAYSPVVQLIPGTEPGSTGTGNIDNTVDFGFASNIGSPFVCDNRFYIIQNVEGTPGAGDWDSTLSYIDTNQTLVPIFVFDGKKLNGLVAYGGYLYCVDQNGGNLYRINSLGVLVDMGQIAGIPNSPTDGQWGGGTALTSGLMIINRYTFSNAQTALYTIDLTSATMVGSPVVTKYAATGANTTGNFGDIVWDPLTGKIYGYNTNDTSNLGLHEINPTTGMCTRVAASALSTFGSLTIDANGLAYGYGSSSSSNSQDTLYVFNRTNGILNGSVTTVGPGPVVTNSDGAACPGAAPSMKMGNLVWNDANNNGIKDSGESGIDGVTLQLFLGGQNPLTAAPAGTTTTSGGGLYSFSNLSPGQYFIYMPTPPAAFPLSSTTTATTDNGVDNDDNGIQTSQGLPVQSPLIGLAGGTESITDGDNDLNTDLSIDFGFLACPAITVNPTSIATSTVGTVYSQTFTVSGGTSPYTWAISSGTLPAGLTLSTAGVLSGTPTSNAATSFTVRVTDKNGCLGTRAYNLTPACTTMTVTPTSLPDAIVGTAYSQTFGITGGTSPYTWAVTSGTLPSGLTLSTAGVLSGTPTAGNASGANVTFTVADKYGCQQSSTINLQVCPAVTVNPATVSTPVVGTLYSQTLTASGGAASYTYALASGTLPSGLTLSGSGVLSGTPTNTTSATFTVNATDANGCLGTRAYTLAPVCPTITATPTTLPDSTIGTAYSQTLTATGGTASYTWAVSSGTLPAGLTLSTGGVISGTPTTSNGTGVNVTFRATDNYGCQGTVTIGMQVCPVVTVSPTTLPAAIQGAPYNQTITSSGGVSSYTYSIISGSLPAGLALSSGGVISGTPTTTGTASFTVQSMDANGCFGTRALSITSNLPVTDFGDYPAFAAAAQTASTEILIVTPASEIQSAGSNTDAEPVNPTTGLANADDTTGNDDEELVIPSVVSGGEVKMDIPVMLAGSVTLGRIGVWADWNGDGDTLDANETVSLSSTSLIGGSNTITATFSPPAGTSVGTKYLRMIVVEGTTAPAFSGISSLKGEVEDYAISVTIPTLDYGDLPDTIIGTSASNYQTLSNDNGPAHTANSRLRLGALVDAEGNGQPNSTATGDGSDDDGVPSLPTLTQNLPATLTITATNTFGSAAFLKAWIDWNNDGNLSANEELGSEISVPNNTSGGSFSFNFTVPSTAVIGSSLGLRIRLASATIPASTGVVGTGEVEDYLVTVNASTVDFGDYPNFAAASRVASTLIKVGTAATDVETSNPTTGSATVDDTTGTDDEELTMPTLQAGTNGTLSIPVTLVSPVTTGRIAVFADWNGDNDVLDTNETVTLSTTSLVTGTNTITATLSPPLGITGGTKFLRIVVTEGTTASTFSGSSTLRGEVEDYAITVNAYTQDFGDLPDTSTTTSTGNYPTLSSHSGPSHTVNATTLRLGATVDTEADGQPNSTASGDGADEDGISSMPVFNRGQSYTIPVSVFNNTGSTARIFGFIDWNNDGDFADAGEALTAVAVSSSASQQAINVTGTTPGTATIGTFGARFRLATATTLTSTGSTGDGEVEDYIVTAACPTLAITPSSLPATTQYASYNQTLTATNGTTPYTWTITSGAIPGGLTLSSTGIFSGNVISASGAYVFTVRATDANGCTATQSYTISVGSGGMSVGNLVFLDENNNGLKDSGERGIPNVPVEIWSVGADGRVNSADDLPVTAGNASVLTSGGMLSTGTFGTIASGFSTLTARTDWTGAYQFTQLPTGVFYLKITPPNKTVFSSKYGTGSTTYSLNLDFPLASATAVLIDNGLDNDSNGVQTIGSFTNSTDAVVAGVGAPVFSMPFTLATATEPGTSNLGSDEYTIDFGLRPCPAIGVSPITVPAVTSGVAYSSTLSASGGIAPYTYAITQGTLPTGLSITTAGVISGTTSTTGTSAITVSATDARGCQGFTTIQISVASAMSISTASLPNGTEGTAYTSTTLAATGGSTPYQNWRISSGTLPAGLTVSSSTGVLSGTPTAPGTYVFTVAVDDALVTPASVTATNGSVETDAWSAITFTPRTTVTGWTLGNSALTGTAAAVQLYGIHNSNVNTTQYGDTPAGSQYLASPFVGSWVSQTVSGFTVGRPYTLRVRYAMRAAYANPATTEAQPPFYGDALWISGYNASAANLFGPVSVNFPEPSSANYDNWATLDVPFVPQTASMVFSYGLDGAAIDDVQFIPTVAATATATKQFTVVIAGNRDWGDLSDTGVGTGAGNYQTLNSDSGPSHYRNSNLRLGATLDIESDGQPNATSTGDDLNGSPDDEDGIASLPTLARGQSFSIPVSVFNNTGSNANVFAFIDWNNDGDFLDPSEALAAAAVSNSASQQSVNVTGTVPGNAVLTQVGLRVRLSSASTLGAFGIATNGEVEDYLVTTTCPAVALSPVSLANGTLSSVYSQTITASGGTASYTFALASGTLPSGVTLNPSSGVLSGTPNVAGTYNFTLRATDANGCSGTQTYAVVMSCPTLSITPASLATGTVGTAYSQTLTASGGASPYGSWTVTSGTLPAGLTLSAAGVISGTPTASTGSAVSLTVRTTDANGCQSSQVISLKICPVITLSPTTLAASTAGSAYSQTITAAGGTAPYTFTLSSGTLPAGLSLSSAGIISGTPTSTASATFVIRAVDANGCAGTSTYTLAPACAAIAISPVSLNAGVQGVAYTAALSATPSASYTWAVASGTLPTGLSLNASTGALVGTPSAAGSYSFTVKAGTGTATVPPLTFSTYNLDLNPGDTFNIRDYVLPKDGSSTPIDWSQVSFTYTAAGANDPTTPADWNLTSFNAGLPVTATTADATAAGNTGTGRFRIYIVRNGQAVYDDHMEMRVDASRTSLVNSAKVSPPIQLACSGTRAYTMRICPVISLTPATLPNGTINTSYSQTITASGGSSPYTYAVSSGTPPAGLTLTSAGLLSGTPTSTTSTTFTITATDANGCSGSLAYTIVPAADSDYGDHSLFTNASSRMNSTLRIGALTDVEGTATTNASATGDDTTGSDDEDGVTLPASITQGGASSLTVNVTNTSGATAFLNVWVDFNQNGSLADAGEQIATNVTIATGTSNSNRSISFTAPASAVLGSAGVRVRFTSTSSPGPTGAIGNGEVEDNVATIVAPTTDYGDFSLFADAYSTGSANLKIGALQDLEGSSTKNSSATGDDNTGSDDEDGVSFPSMTAGQPMTLPVTVTNLTGATAYLNAWIDYNNNGLLTDAGEQIATNMSIVTGTTGGTVNLSFTVPTNAVTAASLIGTRFRLTNVTTPGSTGGVGIGEVEDHTVVILAPLTDFGDFSGAPSVSNTASTNLRLGALVDTEYAATTNATATGDDITGVDDEDGVTLPAMIAGAPATIPVVVTNNTGAIGYLNAWIDYNNNGVFTDAGEQIATNTSVPTGTTSSTFNISTTVPASAVTGTNLGVRARISSDISPGSTGSGGVGEVEDYLVNIAAPTTDFGDYALFGLVTGTANSNLRIGTLVDTEYAATTNSTATGDDITGMDDEDGVTFPSMIAGAPATITATVTNTTGATAYLNAWIDFNGNGVLTDAGEQIAASVAIATGTSNASIGGSITIPATSLTGVPLGARVVITSNSSAGSTGSIGTGEIEDYVVTITAPTTDFGDFSSFADASQGVSPSLRMGNSVDAEYTPTKNATATGDDITGSDDEDGVTLPSMTAGQTLTIPVVATNSTGAMGYLNAWIDFNNNGVLTDSGEQIATNVNIATGSSDATFNINVTVPISAVTGTNVGARFRLSAPTSPGPTGANAAVGEIEDYVVNIAAPTLDFSDFSGMGSASSTANSRLRIGTLVDAEYAITANTAATGDDTTGIDDEDGATVPASMTPGTTIVLPVTVQNKTGANAWLHAWIDFNNDGVLNDATISNGGERLETARVVSSMPTGTILREYWTGISGTLVSDLTNNSLYPNNPTGFDNRSNFTAPTDWADNMGQRMRGWIYPPTSGDYTFWVSGDDETKLYLSTDETAANAVLISSVPGWSSALEWTKYPEQKSVTITLQAGRAYYIEAIQKEGGGGDNLAAAWQLPGTSTGPVVIDGQYLSPWSSTASSGVLQQISFTVPLTASPGAGRGVRFRVTNSSTTGPVGSSGTGEVEDYITTIVAPTIDYGDWSGAADASNASTSNLRLGSLVDAEFVSTKNAAATGDDITGVDDEDGVTLPSLTAGGTFTIPVVVTNTSGAAAFLNAWIDLNNNGSFTDSGEQFATNVSVANGSNNVTINQSLAVPTTAVTGVNLGVRFRLTSSTTPGATGTGGGNGEVEDYVANIAPLTTDFGDFSGFTSASSTRNSNLRLGALTDVEYAAVTNTTATGDDITGSDDEDGVTIPSMMAGAPATIPVVVTNNTGATAFLNAWIDFNNNGDLNDAGEQIATDVSIVTGSTNSTQNLSVTAAAAAVTGVPLGVRVRLTSIASPGSAGAAGSGEVEDYVVTITSPPLDYGDWSGISDAASTANGTLRLGALVDTEYVSTRNAAATGDDTTGVDDEDGVTLPSLTAGAPATIPVVLTNTSGASAYLNVWIDYNNNGVLTDSGEQIATNLVIATGSSNLTRNLNIIVPAGAVTGSNVGIRFRLTSVSSPGVTGTAGTGEVEDYVTSIAVPTTDFGDWNGAADASSLASSNLRMGALADTEYVSTLNAAATGDDITGSDDEDGVVIPSQTPGTSGSATVVVTNNTGATGYLNAWIDYNNNGSFADAGEQIATNTSIATGTNGVTQTVNFIVPVDAVPGQRGARFRLTNTQTPTSVGASGMGEVEDYLVTVTCLPIGLTPATLTTPTVGTAFSQSVSASGGLAPYSYSIGSGTLPAGLALSSTGVISGTPTSSNTATFSVVATDAYGCSGSNSYTVTPVCPAITVNPSTLPSGLVGTGYSQTLTASGGTGPYTYAVSSGTLPAGLTLNTTSGINSGLISGTPTTSNGSGVSVTFRATDANGCSGTRTVTFIICPVITLNPSSLPAPTVGTAYSQTITASGSAAAYTYSLASGTLPTWATLSSAGVLSGTPTNTTPATFTVRATDANACTGTISYTLTPVCPTVTITPASLAQGTVGTAYSQTLSATGGIAPYSSWTITSGTLPTGLSLNASTGVISGTPTATASPATSITVRVNDANGCQGTRTITLQICPVITLAPTTLPTPVIGTAYSQAITAAGGTSSYSYAIISGALPAWATMTSAGTISGTPNNGTPATFTVRATDANGCSGTLSCTLAPNCPTISITPTTSAQGTVGSAYSQTFTAAGGTAPYSSWTVTAGTLPNGLSLNASTGVLSGTPTAAASPATSISVRVTDANGCQGTQAISLQICPVITLVPTTPATPTVSTAYSQTFTASGGAASYTFTLASGALPTWATLSTGGVLSGTPDSPNSATFTLKATDANGCSGTQAYTITPACPTMTISPTTAAAGTVGSAYSQTLSATGGTAPYTAWTVTSGTLPAGLTLSTAGVISGTPTVSSSSLTTVTVRTTDARGCQVSTNVSMRICPVVTVNPTTLAAATTGSSYSQTFSGSGGVSPYVFAVSSGTLPVGLSLDVNTGILSGTPSSTTTANFTIRATDANGCLGTRSFTITPVCPSITVTPATLAAATVNSSYSQTITSSGGTGTMTFAISSGSLPAGLSMTNSLNPGSVIISGTPTSTAAATFTVRATDANGCTGSTTYTITPACPTITVGPATLTTGGVGVAYSQTLSATGGIAPYTLWTVTNGTLPSGLTLNASTGVISGTPTASNGTGVSVTIRATDANGCQGSTALSIKICPVITQSPTTLGTPVVGTAYSQTITGAGGVSPYTFTVSSGALPSGMTLSSSGTISGTTPSATSATFTIRATAADGCSGTASYTITPVCPTLSLVSNSLPTAYLGASYAQALTASGGTAPYTFALQSGDLPGGVLISSSGSFNGTPTAKGTFPITVRVTDANSCSQSFNLTLQVRTLTIGNLVFEDSNNNGLKDLGEPGVANARVQLFSTGNDNAIGGSGAAADTQVGSDFITTSTGAYLFDSLPSGNFYIKVTPPADYLFTGGTVATTDNNVDNNNDGAQPGGSGTPLFSPIINLSGGAESTTDGDTDSDTNLTVDFGLWSSVAVGNFIFLDVNGDGHRNEGESLGNIYVELYAQGTTPGVDDPVSAGTSGCSCKGRYYLDGVNPGSYFLHIPASQFATGMPLEGLLPMSSVVAGDDDVGQDLIYNNNPAVNGASSGLFTLRPGFCPVGAAESGAEGTIDDAIDARVDLTRDLGIVAPAGTGFAASEMIRRYIVTGGFTASVLPGASTFATWSQDTSIGGATADPDEDGIANLLEYALGTDPASPLQPNRFALTQDATTGSLIALLTQPTATHDDLIVSLETLTDLTQAANASAWKRLSMATTTTINADGTLTRSYANLEKLLVFKGLDTGFIRLRIDLDANRDGIPEATVTSGIQGWSRQSFATGARTFSMPLLKSSFFTGRVVSVSANELMLPAILTLPAGSLYLEALDGPLAGQRFDIDSAASSGNTIVLQNAAQSYAGLVNAPISIRMHHTLAELLPPTAFSADDRVLFFDPAASNYTTCTQAGDTWLNEVLSMNSRPIAAHEAALLQVRGSGSTLMFTGEVRLNNFVTPLVDGTQLIAPGWPITTAAPVTGLSSGLAPESADRLRLWDGDTTPDASSYTGYYLDGTTTPSTWAPQTALAPAASIKPFHGFFLIRSSPLQLNQLPPW